ncbi:hypothetical protein LTR37_011628 [Vermiconidia calcicola]|uniref:Uncharacterized protein n=1 Tax=Vermiconidia calcicola TaxID=1690605 RepID=A0ACC3N350_9PEZI|nr:hypothetical protein LTR37_011628 [Vermiconidia calcicola]
MASADTQPQGPTNDITTLASDILTLTKSHQDGSTNAASTAEIIAKAKQLITTLQTPMDHASSLLVSMVEPAVIRTLIAFKVLQTIPTSSEDSISLAELEQKTGVQAALLQRLLRVVVGTGFITSNGDGAYAHTTLSAPYAGGMIPTLFGAIYDELLPTLHLNEYFATHTHAEPDGPESTTHNPISWLAGEEGRMTAFDLMERDPARLKNFHVLSSMAEHWRPVTGFYDYGALASASTGEDIGRVTLVDIGGGDGGILAKILEAYPGLEAEQCVLQDRAPVIALAEGNTSLPEGVKKQVHDFYHPQPVQGAKAYHLRAITHDWSDSVVISILKQIVPAMAADSKVLIADNVLSEDVVGGESGLASMMDLLMMSMGGKERTRKDFERVCGEAGLVVERIWSSGETGERDVGGFAVVECRLK